MRRGPAASPSSQMVTRRTEADFTLREGEEPGVDGEEGSEGLEEEGSGVRERTMEGARGTREMQLNVLLAGLVSLGFTRKVRKGVGGFKGNG